MRAEFYRTDNGSETVATAVWDGRRPVVESSDEETKQAVERVFRPTPVVVDDPSRRSLGAGTQSIIPPGGLDWFLAAAFARAPKEGLTVRVIPEVTGQGGWDPAAAYRTFKQTFRRLVERPDADRAQPGERGPEERARTGDQPRDSDAPPTVK